MAINNNHPWRNNRCIYGWDYLRSLTREQQNTLRVRLTALSGHAGRGKLSRLQWQELNGLQVAVKRLDSIQQTPTE